MRKDWKYILYVALAFGLFLLLKLTSPKQHDWTVTYAPDDKNPYGAYAMNILMANTFLPKSIAHSFKTLYELKDSLKHVDNIFIVCEKFDTGKEDTDVLLNHVARGGTAFIASKNFWGKFADTLKLNTSDYLFKSGNILAPNDTAIVKFAAAAFDTVPEYRYRGDNIPNYFAKFDTTRTTVIAWSDAHQPVTVYVKWGKGNFILNSTPMMFSNICLLSGKNHEFVAATLSYLPKASTLWTENYQRGRREIATPLRFILQNESLRWAYYISVIAILIFMIFEMKRKQRIIPIIKPLPNTTLEFLSTIGNLYYERGQHKNIAEKKINYLLDRIRENYWLNTSPMDENFVLSLSRKAGKNESDIRRLANLIIQIRNANEISADTLIELNDSVEQFQRVNEGLRS
ncbi:MAG: DUF4350 domain-containing protein [Chryseolinea sp.]